MISACKGNHFKLKTGAQRGRFFLCPNFQKFCARWIIFTKGHKKNRPLCAPKSIKLDCDFFAGVAYGFGFAALAVLDKDYAELAVLYHSVI